jgi:hypothetical protein
VEIMGKMGKIMEITSWEKLCSEIYLERKQNTLLF